MLEFWQNGKKIEVNAIYGKGKVGQMVIYGQRCDWGANPNPTIAPLSQYPCPSVFTIVEKKEGNLDGYYILSDSKGNRIKIEYLDLGQVFRHIFLRIYIFFSSFACELL